MPDPREQLEAVYRAERQRLVHTLAKLFPFAGHRPMRRPGPVRFCARAESNPAGDRGVSEELVCLAAHGLRSTTHEISSSGASRCRSTRWPANPVRATKRTTRLATARPRVDAQRRLQQGERAERRRVLVSDILEAYVGTSRNTACTSSGRSSNAVCAANSPADVAREMGLERPARLRAPQQSVCVDPGRGAAARHSRARSWPPSSATARPVRCHSNSPATIARPDLPSRRRTGRTLPQRAAVCRSIKRLLRPGHRTTSPP
jgi:hypothetical protein